MAIPLLRFAIGFAGSWGKIVTVLDYSAPPNRVLGYLPDRPVTFWPTKGKPMTAQIPQPEWFQLTQADSILPRPRINRVTRMLALSTPLLVVGMGYMLAQSSNAGVPAHSILASAPAQTQSSHSSPIAPITQPTGSSEEESGAIGSSVAGGISVPPTGDSDGESDD